MVAMISTYRRMRTILNIHETSVRILRTIPAYVVTTIEFTVVILCRNAVMHYFISLTR